MNNNRRNYYRILQVQPDATPEIIKANYRTLLQKLRMHPDLGGENWNAVLINEAYNTLRHPEKRRAYDEELLKQYNINMLSLGKLNSPESKNKRNGYHDKHGNKRNFYRILNIQPDAPVAIIKSSYLTQINSSPLPRILLDQAYTVLSDPERRKLYDKLLASHSHADAVAKLFLRNKKNPLGKYHLTEYSRSKIQNKTKSQISRKNQGYDPQIIHYCSFCKTPHNYNLNKKYIQHCTECDSPLFPPPKTLLDQPRRDLSRIVQSGDIHFYTYWPGQAYPARLADISPTGLKLSTQSALDKDMIIKLVGDDFGAVGNVSYCQRQGAEYTSGVRFVTVQFEKQKGHFISASA